MSDLSAAAAALGVPESIVKRSAEARAQAMGASVDEILAAWAGGAPVPAQQSAPPAIESEDAGTTSAPAAASATEAPAPSMPAATAAAAEVVAAPVVSEVNAQEALRYPAVVTVPTAGLLERTVGSIPRWLAAAFFILPYSASSNSPRPQVSIAGKEPNSPWIASPVFWRIATDRRSRAEVLLAESPTLSPLAVRSSLVRWSRPPTVRAVMEPKAKVEPVLLSPVY